MDIPKGKVFGPFAGVISEQKASPSTMHTFICKVKDSSTLGFKYFHANKNEKKKCDWLKMIQPPFGSKSNNIVVYGNNDGVHYKAIEDIAIGEELLALCEDHQPGSIRKWAVSSRKKRPSVIVLKKTGGDEALGLSESVQVETQKRERSRKRTPRRISKRLAIQEKNSDNSNSEQVEHCSSTSPSYDAKQPVDSNISLESPTPAKRKRTAKFTSFEDKSSPQDETNNNLCQDHDELFDDCTAKSSTENTERMDSKDVANHTGNSNCVEESDLKCAECNISFKQQKYLKRHRTKFHTERRCQQCESVFLNLADLKKHVREEHAGKDDLHAACHICNKIFSKSYLPGHIKSHDNAYKCKICQKTFSCGSNLRKHLQKHKPGYHPKKKGVIVTRKKCDTCGKMLNGNQALKAHMRLHTGERPFKCDKCDWAFVQRTHLRRHKMVKHGDGKQLGKHQCDQCQRWYSNKSVLEMHVITIHQGLRPFKCNMCKDTFNIQGLLLRHQRELHQMDVDLPEDQRKYLCKEDGCGKKFSLQSDLNKHIFEHTGVHPHQCKECNSYFSSSGNLGKHVRRIHRGVKISESKADSSDERFKCTLCEKVFSNAASLREHGRIHTGERIKCSKCSSTFVQRSGLRKHLRCLRCPGLKKEMEDRGEDAKPKIYKRSRTWKCNECDKFFLGPSDLKAHSRVHSGERPFTCSICGKSFTQPGNLTKHEKYVHGGEKRPKEIKREKRYSCSLCCKSFSSPGDLSMHCRTHTGVKPFECTHCGMAFTQRGNLKKHVFRWHTMNALKSHRKPSNHEGQEERVVIKGLESSSMSTSNASTTCSVVLPPSFITNNKEVLVTNVPIAMAAMLKQKATEVAKSSQPSSFSVTSLIQCLTATQKAISSASTSVVESSESTPRPIMKQIKATSQATSKAMSPPTTPVTTPQNELIKLPDFRASKATLTSNSMPAVSNFMKLTDPQSVSCSPVYQLDLVKNFLPTKLQAPVDAKHSNPMFTEPQASSTSTISTKEIQRVHDFLTDSNLLDIGIQKSSAGSHAHTQSLNFNGDFTGQVRGMEFAQTDLGSPRFRFSGRSTFARMQPESPKGLHLPFDSQQLAAGSFLASQRLTHPDIQRQARVARREAFPNVMDTQSEFSIASSHSSLHHNFANVSLPQPLPGVGNYFHPPGKVLTPPWDPTNIRDTGMHVSGSQMPGMLVQKSFQIIGNGSSDVRK
ncbi:uncharacterized protein LOC135691653 isoform X1 [Rhopilema esculentum]|uniref:uncharacterized protein LOC135691653 isoform X1 n=1 Tax=Rhopilema esculentum TaxID=499914 RepID=UPI0031D3D746